MWELLFDGLSDWALNWAPRPVRIGCTILLILALLAIIGLVIWAQFK